MYCSNCGWSNPDEKTHCEKCGNYLGGMSDSSGKSTVRQGSPPSQNFTGTIVGKQAPGLTIQEPTPPPADPAPPDDAFEETPTTPCPHCFYPIAEGVEICPSCERPIQAAATEENTETPVETPEPETTQTFNRTIRNDQALPADGAAGFSATIDPFRSNFTPPAAVEHCVLVPIQRENETPLPEISFTDQDQIEAPITLNRNNLEPGNLTITSGKQASLSFEDGAWHIADNSDLGTTFIRISRKTPLQDGDILLIGNRKFLVKISTDA